MSDTEDTVTETLEALPEEENQKKSEEVNEEKKVRFNVDKKKEYVIDWKEELMNKIVETCNGWMKKHCKENTLPEGNTVHAFYIDYVHAFYFRNTKDMSSMNAVYKVGRMETELPYENDELDEDDVPVMISIQVTKDETFSKIFIF